jgi:RNA polymerase sigma-70 factor, ECF subfamily
MKEKGSPSVTAIEPRTASEPELIERIIRGERQLFHHLVRPYERAVYVAAYAVLRRHEDAEEAAQEAMIKALAHLNQLTNPVKFKPWLLHIAVNEARLKRRRSHASLFESIEDGSTADGEMFMPRDFADWREIPSEILERKETRTAISAALEKLPLIYRDVFVLRDVEQLSTGECAESLGISEQAVKVRLHRARLRMREELAPIFRKSWLERLISLRGKKPW